MIRSNTNADEALEVENNHPLRLHVLTQHRQTSINATYQLPNPPTAGIFEGSIYVWLRIQPRRPTTVYFEAHTSSLL